MSRVLVVEAGLATAWGFGVAACWRGLLGGNPAFSEINRFDSRSMQSRLAAIVPELRPSPSRSLVMGLLSPLLEEVEGRVPSDALVLLATTTGEVDFLEEYIAGADRQATAACRDVRSAGDSRLDRLLRRVCDACRVKDPGRIVSAACASSTAALALGASLVRRKERDAVLVVACDAVTEFIMAGFSSLMALDPDGARPFDRNRRGLTVGEAGAVALLMSEERAARESRHSLGEIAGWGLSGDANHMTGPSRDGAGLASAIRQALRSADMPAERIGSISAHGTGTPYNDSMELKAFAKIFAQPVPIYSIKGSIGHTMGAAGLVEAVMALASMHEQVVPPTSNLREIDPEAEGWVSTGAVKTRRMDVVLSTNSGFGGVNAALVLRT